MCYNNEDEYANRPPQRQQRRRSRVDDLPQNENATIDNINCKFFAVDTHRYSPVHACSKCGEYMCAVITPERSETNRKFLLGIQQNVRRNGNHAIAASIITYWHNRIEIHGQTIMQSAVRPHRLKEYIV